jgi:hypothetical protein
MKKSLLFAFALLFATAAMAQTRTTYLEESFNGTSIPSGWSVVGAGTNNWSISGTDNAGGQANELHLNWSPQFSGISRFVSPVIDLSGVNSVVISFKHMLDYYESNATLGIATTSNGGSTWNQAWSQPFTTDALGTITQMINTADVGSANFQFCIFYSGSSYNYDHWYFDDIKVFTLENLDVAVTSTTMPDIQGIGNLTVNLGVMNYGSTQVTSITASYEVDGAEPVEQTFTVNLGSLATTSLNFTQPIALENPGAYTVTMRVLQVNGQEDDIAENNMLVKAVSVPLDNVQRIPMIEHFSSSTCPPCVAVNNSMNTFCNNNPGRFTYTKYQMNWPGNGDPYYTAEGGVRRTYYGVSAVPFIELDGASNSGSVNQNVFNQHANQPGYFDVRGSFTTDGNTIHVIADVMPYVDVEARVYVSVNEKVTTGNVGTNGETSFHHVFMKMLPNAEGSTIAFNATELERLEFTQNLSGTHVEEMSDLEVSIWVQNYGSKYVYNSHFAYEYTDIHPYPVENLTLTADDNNMTATWNAPTEGNPTGYKVYVNGEVVEENTTATTYSFEGNPDQFNVVGVEALYADNKISVRAVATLAEALQDLGLVTEEQSFELNEDVLSAEVSVSNANHNTQADINILSIEEVNEEEVQYLTITAEELPYVLPYNEGFSFVIEPNTLGEEKSVAHTKVVVTSDAGVLEFEVAIDGEVLSVTEVSAEPKLYPNPASSNIRIEGNAIESVKVYNIMGALVESISVNDNNVDVNLSQYSNGVYFFNIRQSDGTVSNQRVVVSH